MGLNKTVGQSFLPKNFGLKHFMFEDDKLGEVNYYVTVNKINESKPLLLFVDGSSALPLYCIIKKSDGTKQLRTGIAFDLQKLSERFHVAVISKPGVPFSDSLNVESMKAFKRAYEPPQAYWELLSHQWRVNSASKVIDELLKELPVKDDEVIAFGYSEGGMVVPKLALNNKNITKILNIVGGGLNQFYDLIVEERIKARLGKISSEKAQNNIDSLFKRYKDVYKNPKSIDKEFWGDTYLRWSSFCTDIPMEDMTKLDIPILMITAGEDSNAPIIPLDYVKLEFLRLGKENLTYKVYPNCDHYFYDIVKNKDRLDEVIDYMLGWIEDN